MFEFDWHNLFGAVGVVLLLVAYFMLQSDRLNVRQWQFSFLNALGSLLILLSLLVDFNLSAFAIELFWLAISLYGLLRHHQPPAESNH